MSAVALAAPPAGQTLIPYRHVPSMWIRNPARLPLLDVVESAGTSCTGPYGDRAGDLCLCWWAPWEVDDEDYEPVAGDPLADVPAAEPWAPRTVR